MSKEVDGRLIKVESPLTACWDTPNGALCGEFFNELKNPYYIGDQPGLTQTAGWVDAWTSAPSVYAVAAKNTTDIVAAVNFARKNKLRLVVKGGGHSYQGTSNSADSLLIWTRAMNSVTLHDAFVGKGCEGKQAPQYAVTVQSGAIWMHTYEAVTTKGGSYVQGGGCGTVGVAGLIQSGGFGSFSKNYGIAAAGLIEAEIVTADGVARIANACTNPDLFWGIKGGGGGSLGVVTKVTLRTRELPEFFGGVFGAIKAASNEAYQRLISKVISFYQESLFNRHWGEQIVFKPGNKVDIRMVFQGLTKLEAENVWLPFLEWLGNFPKEFSMEQPITIAALPARFFWDAAFLKKYVPTLIGQDKRANAPIGNIFWAGDGEEAGQILNAYRSAWLPASLLDKTEQNRLVDALFASTRHWSMSLHFNKGLAGAPVEDIEAARNTAMNPAVLDAFALAITASNDALAFKGILGHEPNVARGRRNAVEVEKAMDELLKAAPNAGSYVSESNFFEPNWQRSFWGTNYPRLLGVKKKYDPDGLFFVHHGVGCEEWSEDGFVQLKSR
ncbi:MAG: FAD-dependent oxidoreductase [Pyrinomonadaceae bacterium]